MIPGRFSGHETLENPAIGKPMRAAKKLEIIRLPDPVNIRSRKADFVASYVNYYVCKRCGDRRTIWRQGRGRQGKGIAAIALSGANDRDAEC